MNLKKIDQINFYSNIKMTNFELALALNAYKIYKKSHKLLIRISMQYSYVIEFI